MAKLGALPYTPTDGEIVEPGRTPVGMLDWWDAIKAAVNSIALAQMGADSVGTTQVIDRNITGTKVALATLLGENIADDEIDSKHYVALSIDTEHYSAASVTAPKLAPMFESWALTEVATDTVTETDWHDLVSSEEAVTLDVPSDGMAYGICEINESGITASLRLVYVTGGGSPVQVGQDIEADRDERVVVGGAFSNLAAAAYTFKLQAKVSSGTGTYKKYSHHGLTVPHR